MIFIGRNMKYVCVITALAFMGNGMCVVRNAFHGRPTYMEPIVGPTLFIAALAVCAGSCAGTYLVNGQQHPRIKIAVSIGAAGACVPLLGAIKKIVTQKG